VCRKLIPFFVHGSSRKGAEIGLGAEGCSQVMRWVRARRSEMRSKSMLDIRKCKNESK
jgi:hypothetical protein